jgi:ribonuclease H2 subunit C
VGTFDEVMVWGHGGQVDVNQDVYARGLGEWVEWAGRMHGDEDEEVQKKA